MRMASSVLAALCFSFGLLLSMPTASAASDWDNCQSLVMAERIQGCSNIIRQKRGGNKRLAQAYHNRAFAYEYEKDFDNAILDYGKSAQSDPELGTSHNRLGSLYAAEKRDYEKAAFHYTRAIEHSAQEGPEFNAENYHFRGRVYKALNKPEQAKADFTKSLSLYTEMERATPKNHHLALRGAVYVDLGDFDQAMKHLNEAIEKGPRASIFWSDALASRGDVYVARGEFALAIADYGKSLESSFAAATALYRRGIAYEKSGDKQRAIADFRKSIEKHKDRDSREAIARLEASR